MTDLQRNLFFVLRNQEELNAAEDDSARAAVSRGGREQRWTCSTGSSGIRLHMSGEALCVRKCRTVSVSDPI